MKTTKSKLAVMATVLLISGCSASIDSWRINVANDKCKDHGGISRIDLIFYRATCNDGDSFAVTVNASD